MSAMDETSEPDTNAGEKLQCSRYSTQKKTKIKQCAYGHIQHVLTTKKAFKERISQN